MKEIEKDIITGKKERGEGSEGKRVEIKGSIDNKQGRVKESGKMKK